MRSFVIINFSFNFWLINLGSKLLMVNRLLLAITNKRLKTMPAVDRRLTEKVSRIQAYISFLLTAGFSLSKRKGIIASCYEKKRNGFLSLEMKTLFLLGSSISWLIKKRCQLMSPGKRRFIKLRNQMVLRF